MKILSLYLPQFHRIPENDLWWGNGFTEWTAVKAAKPLFKGHNQPVVPKDLDYYNLLDKRVMQRQAEMMQKYKIDGQCFYHYYFANGKKILEKPAENLLKWKEINMPFCFSWANESWIRSWSFYAGVNGNPWFDIFDKNSEKTSDNGILLEQKYGDRREWEAHFEYLLPFFKDERYIKEGGKPVFVFHMPEKIPVLNEMVSCWKELAVKAGFPGMYFIGAYCRRRGALDNVILIEPQSTLNQYPDIFLKEKYGVWRVVDYDKLWNVIINKGVNRNICLGAFCGYDDTPRRGKNGTIVENASPERFEGYLKKLLYKAESIESPFIFINAWNEWGEGMHLEPDEKNGYRYLEAVLNARDNYETGIDKTWELFEEIEETHRKCEIRYKQYWKTLDKMLVLKEKNICISKRLESQGISIIIYGIGMLGKHFIEMFENKSTIVGVIDKKFENKIDYKGLAVINDITDLPEVDIIVNTVMYEQDIISETFRKVTSVPVMELYNFLEWVDE